MKKIICMILLLALSVVFAVSACFYISEYLQDKEQLDELESIAQTVNDNEQNSDNKYAELYAQNSDFMGWLRIDGTGIDYPVMQSKDDPDFYLKHNFSKEYSRFGIPYMQENCGLSSDNIIIYGHNIKSKSMFNELTEYKDKDFYTAHKYITFDTLDEQRIYEVIAIFKTVAYSDSGFQYYDFVNANTEKNLTIMWQKAGRFLFMTQALRPNMAINCLRFPPANIHRKTADLQSLPS